MRPFRAVVSGTGQGGSGWAERRLSHVRTHLRLSHRIRKTHSLGVSQSAEVQSLMDKSNEAQRLVGTPMVEANESDLHPLATERQ